MTATLPLALFEPEPSPTPVPRVIGLDVSLSGTGIASSRGWCRVIGRDKVTTLPLVARIQAVDELAADILDNVGHPDLVVIEAPAFSRTGGGAVERHALWWKLARALVRRNVPVAEVTPGSRMRYATGKGRVTKNVVVDAVARRFPMFETSGDDNLADAVVLCAMGMDHLGHPLAAMPQAHRAALKAVNWPVVP